MTRNDFQLIAMVLKEAKEGQEDHDAVSRRFATALRHLNPRFNSEKFLKACGVILTPDEEPG